MMEIVAPLSYLKLRQSVSGLTGILVVGDLPCNDFQVNKYERPIAL